MENEEKREELESNTTNVDESVDTNTKDVEPEEKVPTIEKEPEVTNETTPVEEPTPKVEDTPVNTKVPNDPNSKGKNGWLKYVLIGIGAVIIILIVLLIRGCGNRKYKIILHYGDEQVEVDQNFKVSDLDVSGGKITFLVDSDGNVVNPKGKLDPEKEYSGHIIPDGKEKVKVTYKNGNSKFTIEYQKGAGLLFPKDPKKAGYVFLGWQDESTKEFPKIMTPVMHDMTLVAKFGVKVNSNCKLNCDTNGDGKCDSNCDTNGDGKADSKLKPDGEKTCKLNCDTNGDGKCDSNCDTNGDGNADHNIDTNGDGKPDTNVKPNGNQLCTLNCDTNGDGTPDTNKDTNGDGNPDTNIDTDGDGTPDVNVDTNGDGKCDKDCIEGGLPIRQGASKSYYSCTDPTPMALINKGMTFVYLIIDGKNIPESEFVDKGDYKVYNYGKDYM